MALEARINRRIEETPAAHTKVSPDAVAPIPQAPTKPVRAQILPAGSSGEDKAGFVEGFIEGTDTEGSAMKRQDKSVSFAGHVGSFVSNRASGDAMRSVVQAGAELFSPDVKNMRDSLRRLREISPTRADAIEYEYGVGREKTKQEWITQAAGGLGEIALTLATAGGSGIVRSVGRTVLGKSVARTGEQLLVKGGIDVVGRAGGTIAKMGQVGRYIAGGAAKGASWARRGLYASSIGAAYGSLYGFLNGLQHGGDWEMAAKQAGYGGAAGAVLGGGTMAVAAGAVKTGKAISNAAGFVAERLPVTVRKAVLEERYGLKTWIRGQVSPEAADKVMKGLQAGGAAKGESIGPLQSEGMQVGMFKNPSKISKASKFLTAERGGMKFWGDDKDTNIMLYQILNKKGIFTDPKNVEKALADNPDLGKVLDFVNTKLKEEGAAAQRLGIDIKADHELVHGKAVAGNTPASKLEPDYGFPRSTVRVELSRGARKKLAAAKTAEERVSIFDKNNDAVEWMMTEAVESGTFKTKEEAYSTYYDWMDFMTEGRHVKDQDNAYFKWMVENGHAESVEKAAKSAASDRMFENNALTPRSMSLDYSRKTPLPWHDPNIGRGLVNYIGSARQRMTYAEEFGIDDNLITEVMGKMKSGDQEPFKKTIQSITGALRKNQTDVAIGDLIKMFSTTLLTMSAPVNLALGQINNLLRGDIFSLGKGIATALSQKGIAEQIKRGVYASHLMQDLAPIRNFSSRASERMLRYSGFTVTEMANRAVASHIGVDIAERSIPTRKLNSMEIRSAADDFARAQKTIESTGLNVKQKEAVATLKAEFGDDVKIDVGDVAGAERLIEKEAARKEKELARIARQEKLLQSDLMGEAKGVTSEDLEDIREEIKAIEKSLGKKPKKTEAVEPTTFSEAQVEEAKATALTLKKEQMQRMLENAKKRQEELQSVADGQAFEMPPETPVKKTKKVVDPDQRIAQKNQELLDLEDARANIEERSARKTELLQSIVDSYKTAEKELRASNPELFRSEALMEARRAETKGMGSRRQREELESLGLDADEVIARGYLTDEEKTTASINFVAQTQGSNDPLTVPEYANHAIGSIFYQFKKFGYIQGNLMAKEIGKVLKGAEAGELMSAYDAVRFLGITLGLYPAARGVLSDVRKIATGQIEPEDAFEFNKYWEGIGMLSAFGIYADYMAAAQRRNLLGAIVGPSPQTAIEFAENLLASGKGDFDKRVKTIFTNELNLARRKAGILQVPLNALFPPK